MDLPVREPRQPIEPRSKDYLHGAYQEIRLIEINRSTLPTRSVEVLYFAPSQDVPFPVRIADVTPQEWEQVQRGS